MGVRMGPDPVQFMTFYEGSLDAERNACVDRGGHLQAQETGLRQKQAFWRLHLRFLAPRTVRKCLLVPLWFAV